MQVYFHPASRGVELNLQNLLKRAKKLFLTDQVYFEKTAPGLIPFLSGDFILSDYLKLDDGVMNTYFQNWMASTDDILADLASRFINRKIFKSVTFDKDSEKDLKKLN